MAKRKTRGEGAAVAQTAAPAETPLPKPTGSPLGWTFWSTWLACKRKWYLQYVLLLTPRATKEPLVIGTIYHMLHEGKTRAQIESVGPEYVKLFAEGHRLFEARTGPFAPAMPEARGREVPMTIESGPLRSMYTTRLDRLEEGNVREFKTAWTTKEEDARNWSVNGEIIGELIASGEPMVTVDIVSKKKTNTEFKQVQVKLDARKKSAFEGLISDAIKEIHERLSWLPTAKMMPHLAPIPLDRSFPTNLHECVGKYGVCDFYNHCWGEEKQKALEFTKRPANAAWRKLFFFGAVT